MRTLFVVAGVLLVLIILVSTGVFTGQMCVQHLGCLESTDRGLSLVGTGPAGR